MTGRSPAAVFVLSQATPLRGMERAAADTVAALQADGLDVSLHALVTRPRTGRVGRLLDLAASFAAARRLVRQPGPPLVLVGIWVGLRVLPFRRPCDREVVAWEHSLTRERRAALRSFDAVARLVLPLYARRARRVVAVSAAVATALAEQPGVGGRVVVVANPVGKDPLTGTGRREPAPVPAGGRLLAVGGLEPLKNPELALEALVMVPGAHLDVAGGGARLPALRRRAEELGVAGRVTWHGHTDRVPELLDACDAVIHTSRSETFGYALLEAAGAHRPVVAVATEQARHLIPSLVPGTTTAADAAALAAAVRAVLAAPPPVAEFAAADAARERAYGREALVAGWRAVLDPGEPGSRGLRAP
ncbi:glycosyltransferase family 4 protein [Streptomyces sp. NP160]|uniref:glycosyltransferase n=1 Tax=Streptomyces sp. NP160 TaxID=2586637 RepID=UPI00111B7FA1|nr:glycosyltransferase [Streptomyces sp. NP160]TNM68757.1 glycosyltransferase family 4 protein [Streptomyces sp. NP160]